MAMDKALVDSPGGQISLTDPMRGHCRHVRSTADMSAIMFKALSMPRPI